MRKKGIPIFHTQMTEGRDLIAPNLKSKRIDFVGDPDEWEICVPGTWGYELVFPPKNGEDVFQKNTNDAFSNSDLKKKLDSLGVETLIIFGGYTHACVSSTVRSAVTNGFDVVLVTDLVCSPDEAQKFHEVTLEILGNFFSYNMTSEEIISSL